MFPNSWTGTTTFNLPFGVNVSVYVLVWIIVLAALFFIWRRGRALGFVRWTTQDILIVAMLGVLLEVYDNLIGDQFITPIINLIPLGHALALNDLPYMFLLMVGIAMIRKPGAATAMVFLNFLLMQLFYSGQGVNVLAWPYGLMQGVFVDLYFVLRGNRVFAQSGPRAITDGSFMGALRAFPAVTFQSAIMSPLLFGNTKTLGYILLYTLFNLIGNGVEAAISAPFAIRIAQSVNPSARRTAPVEREGSDVSARVVPQPANEGRAS